MNDRILKGVAAAGLLIGGVFGLAGSFAPSAALRGLAWGTDGVGLVVATLAGWAWSLLKPGPGR